MALAKRLLLKGLSFDKFVCISFVEMIDHNIYFISRGFVSWLLHLRAAKQKLARWSFPRLTRVNELSELSSD